MTRGIASARPLPLRDRAAELSGWPRTPLASLPNLPLEDALQFVHLYADQGSPKFDRAALCWLGRYLDEGSPTLAQFAEVAATLAAKDPTAP